MKLSRTLEVLQGWNLINSTLASSSIYWALLYVLPSGGPLKWTEIQPQSQQDRQGNELLMLMDHLIYSLARIVVKTISSA